MHFAPCGVAGQAEENTLTYLPSFARVLIKHANLFTVFCPCVDKKSEANYQIYRVTYIYIHILSYIFVHKYMHTINLIYIYIYIYKIFCMHIFVYRII